MTDELLKMNPPAETPMPSEDVLQNEGEVKDSHQWTCPIRSPTESSTRSTEATPRKMEFAGCSRTQRVTMKGKGEGVCTDE